MSTVPRFFHPSSDELYSYWNARRGGRQAPFRSEIEPSDIRNLLADIFILDVDAKTVFMAPCWYARLYDPLSRT